MSLESVQTAPCLANVVVVSTIKLMPAVFLYENYQIFTLLKGEPVTWDDIYLFFCFRYSVSWQPRCMP